jgi:ParB family chromosome partitioning protein
MADERSRRPMGRGLSALMADVGVGVGDASPSRDRVVPVDHIRPNPDQPRRTFAPEALEELTRSIAAKGIIQPLIVRPIDGAVERYEIIAGERRWRAAQRAELHEVPVVIRDFDDGEVIEVAIVENIQRSDLTPLEEAAGYRHLMTRFGHTQEQVAEALGNSRSHIANLLRLLTLPDAIKSHVEAGRLSAGHARALLTATNAEALATEIIGKGLSVRETEALVRRTGAERKPSKRKARDADTLALEGDLSGALGMRVSIEHGAAGDGGRLTIRYRSLEQLDGLCELLSNGLERN